MQNAKANKQAHRSVVVTEHDKQMTANYANTAVSKDGESFDATKHVYSL